MANGTKRKKGTSSKDKATKDPDGSTEVTSQITSEGLDMQEPSPSHRRRGKNKTRQPSEPTSETGEPINDPADSELESRARFDGDTPHPPTVPLPASPSNPFTWQDTTPSQTSRPRVRRSSSQESWSSVSSATPTPGTLIPIGKTPSHTLSRAKDVWSFYEPYHDEVQKEDRRWCIFCRHNSIARTNVCITTFAESTGTSTLRKHLVDTHPEAWITACKEMNVTITAKAAQGALRSHKKSTGGENKPMASEGKAGQKPFSHDAFIDALIEWIVADDQSLNVIESPQLRSIFLLLRQELRDTDIPHKTKLRDRVVEVWEEHLKKLTEELNAALGKVSFTTDMWTDTNLSPFMAVTAHWIQAVKEQNESGEHLAKAFIYVLDRIKITKRIGWITLDNAGNNNTLVNHMETELHRRHIKFDAVRNRIRCFPHVVNLACKAVIEAIGSYSRDMLTSPFANDIKRDPIASVRAIVRTIRSSSLRRQYFSGIVKTLDLDDLELLRDVETRWSSTLLMIERALELQPAITQFLINNDFNDLRKHQIEKEEWEALDLCKEILRVPHLFQQRLSAETTPTLSQAVPAYTSMGKLWEKMQEKYPRAHGVIQRGRDKLESYSELTELTPAYVLAMFVNPCQKLRWHITNEAEHVPRIKQMIIRETWQLREYRIKSTIKTPARPPKKKYHDPAWEDMMEEFDEHLEPTQTVRSGNQSLEAEVEAYLTDNRENECVYPTIFQMAMDILPIQGSAVPCERVFSSAKDTMTARRNRIQADLMEALQMLKYSFRSGYTLNFTEGTSREMELKALEEDTSSVHAIPKDMVGFIQSLLPPEKSGQVL